MCYALEMLLEASAISVLDSIVPCKDSWHRSDEIVLVAGSSAVMMQYQFRY